MFEEYMKFLFATLCTGLVISLLAVIVVSIQRFIG